MAQETSEGIRRLLLLREVEDFFYQEAELLDQRLYEDWLELFTEDARYFMPMRRNVKFDQMARENTSGLGDMSWFDEGKDTLSQRVRQIMTGIHWAEEPQSRVCHIVSNVQLLREEGDQVTAKSRFVIYRNRVETETDFFVGKREDVLRRVDGAWKIASRRITLDQNVLLAKNLTVFF